MASIYKNACLTIIASSGKDADAGLPLSIPHPMATTGAPQFLADALREQTPWNQRGWTFQELALSRRWILFLEEKCLWRCPLGAWGDWRGNEEVLRKRGVSSEEGISIYSILDNSLHSWPDMLSESDEYYRYVCEYNRRKLSNARDGLFAFLGIIDYLKPVLGSIIFGIPEKWFVRGVKWQPTDSVTRRDATNLPTWSWVGWQGSIYHSRKQHVDPVRWSIHHDGKLRSLQPGLVTHLADASQNIGLEGLSISQTEPQIDGYGTLLYGRTHKARVFAVPDHAMYMQGGTLSNDEDVTNAAVLVILGQRGEACGAIQLHNNRNHDPPDHPFSVKLIALSKSRGPPFPYPLRERTAHEEVDLWEVTELGIRTERILKSSRHWTHDSDEEDGLSSDSTYWYYNVMLVKDVDNVCYREGLGWIESDVWEDIATEDVDVVLG